MRLCTTEALSSAESAKGVLKDPASHTQSIHILPQPYALFPAACSPLWISPWDCPPSPNRVVNTPQSSAHPPHRLWHPTFQRRGPIHLSHALGTGPRPPPQSPCRPGESTPPTTGATLNHRSSVPGSSAPFTCPRARWRRAALRSPRPRVGVAYRAPRTQSTSSFDLMDSTALPSMGSTSTRDSIFFTAWITVEWSLPPNLPPISGNDAPVYLRHRYIAI